jgi:transposase-like protein
MSLAQKALESMNDQTVRHLLRLAESKYKHDARRLFQLGVKATGKKPMTLITDGLPAYHDACNKANRKT